MFQPGDRIRYTGAYRNACGWLKPNQREGAFIRCTSKAQARGDVGYAQFDNCRDKSTAFYLGDIELIEDGAVEPEDWS